MPKLKTKSGAKKRFKMTGTGKVKAAAQGKRHGMIKRHAKFIRDARGTMVLDDSDGRADGEAIVRPEGSAEEPFRTYGGDTVLRIPKRNDDDEGLIAEIQDKVFDIYFEGDACPRGEPSHRSDAGGDRRFPQSPRLVQHQASRVPPRRWHRGRDPRGMGHA